jgi:hypothetical protein
VKGPDAAYALISAEDRLLRSLEMAEAVTKACETRAIAVPGAVAMADRQLQRAVISWQEALKDYLFASQGDGDHV